ncbi:MAG TPA: hypothetical protein VFE36_11015 [Candidatus Baltobacteraceae bacterium]|nr:hypothetical protein [Candidatus Baltobacteraceae bacterium]
MRTSFGSICRLLLVAAACALVACSGNGATPGQSAMGFTPAVSPKAITVTVHTVVGSKNLANILVKLWRCKTNEWAFCAGGSAPRVLLAKGKSNNRGIVKLTANFTASQLLCAEASWKTSNASSDVASCTKPFPTTVTIDFDRPAIK